MTVTALETIETDLILKFGWIGWRGNLLDINSLLNWLYKEYGILLEERKEGGLKLIFQNQVLCIYFSISEKYDIITKILPDILLLWKCEDGELSGPSLENYEEPNTEWT